MNENNSSFTELELRFLKFGKTCKMYCHDITIDTITKVYISQLVRSSSSIGANYIEANEKLGEKDLIHKLKIARREAKESIYWLNYLDEHAININISLQDEASQIRRILSAIILKLENKQGRD